MIWIALAALIRTLFFGGAITPKALNVVADRISVEVKDAARKKAAQEVVKEMINSRKEQRDHAAPLVRDLTATLARHDSNAAGLDGVFLRLDQLGRDADEDALRLRDKLRGVLTREEWIAVFNARPARGGSN